MTILPQDYTKPEIGDYILGNEDHPEQMILISNIVGKQVHLYHYDVGVQPARVISADTCCSLEELVEIVQKQAAFVKREDKK